MQKMQETQAQSLGGEDSPGEGNSNPLQYFCLENLMDRGAWQPTVQRFPKSWTQLSAHTHTHTHTHTQASCIKLVVQFYRLLSMNGMSGAFFTSLNVYHNFPSPLYFRSI